jgi:hypothetical protein
MSQLSDPAVDADAREALAVQLVQEWVAEAMRPGGLLKWGIVAPLLPFGASAPAGGEVEGEGMREEEEGGRYAGTASWESDGEAAAGGESGGEEGAATDDDDLILPALRVALLCGGVSVARRDAALTAARDAVRLLQTDAYWGTVRPELEEGSVEGLSGGAGGREPMQEGRAACHATGSCPLALAWVAFLAAQPLLFGGARCVCASCPLPSQAGACER